MGRLSRVVKRTITLNQLAEIDPDPRGKSLESVYKPPASNGVTNVPAITKWVPQTSPAWYKGDIVAFVGGSQEWEIVNVEHTHNMKRFTIQNLTDTSVGKSYSIPATSLRLVRMRQVTP